MLSTPLASLHLLLAYVVAGKAWLNETNSNATNASDTSTVSNNSTASDSSTNTNSSLSQQSDSIVNITKCQTAFPSELRHMNSLYPNVTYAPTTLFLALHESNNSFQVATQVQFHGLPFPPPAPGEEFREGCELQLKVPNADLTKTNGPWPLIGVYQAKREPGAATSWNTYAARNLTGKETAVPDPSDTPLVFPRPIFGEDGNEKDVAFLIGRANGDAKALERSRSNGGLVVVNTVECNETLTFQMGMTLPNDDPVVNYWDFINVAPPQMPDQGWRLVYGC